MNIYITVSQAYITVL